jgi:signal transduction histidine kinase
MSRLLIIAEDPEHASEVRALLEQHGLSDEILVHADPARDVDAHHKLHRLAQVGTLAAGAAHEINNLLTYLSITLSQSVRRAETHTGEEPTANWKAALEVCDRMQSIVRDLTGFARSGSEGHTLLGIEDVLDEAVRLGEASLRGRAEVVREAGTELPHLRANRVQLVQVFLNLIINSAQAIESTARDGGHIRIRTAADRGGVRVDVEDDGCGIAPENMPRIFEAFYTTKPNEVGTGLGLFLTRAIVRKHGGDVEVSSQVGAGTRISVSLPAATRSP